MFASLGKLFRVSLGTLSKPVQEFFLKILTKLMDFLELRFNTIIKHLSKVGTGGLAVGLLANMTDSIVNGAVDKFGFFSRVLGIRTIFSNVDSIVTPYIAPYCNTSFLGAFTAFGGVEAINIIINSCAYALVFWLSVVVFKWVVGLLPALIRLVATIV